jgi:outer membrane immunogenic protein
MKRILFATVALSALVAAPAMGADLARPAPPAPYKAPPPVYFYSWTGCYIGGHAGGLWTRKEWFDHDPGDVGTIFYGQSDGAHNPSGFLGGLQAGCDYQFAGGFVIGIAGDYAWTNVDATSNSVLFPGQINHSRVKGLASVTGRVGYAWDRFLGYVKGGGAWENDNHDYTDPLGCACTGTASVSRSGWTVGIGGEYAFTNFLTGFAEYDYYDFGTRDITFLQTDGFTFVYGIKETKSVFKVGLNLRWGAGPVVANY